MIAQPKDLIHAWYLMSAALELLSTIDFVKRSAG